MLAQTVNQELLARIQNRVVDCGTTQVYSGDDIQVGFPFRKHPIVAHP